MKNLINRTAVVTKMHDGLGHDSNDSKYIGKAYGKVVKLVALVPKTTDFYITDFFIPEFIEENNDYVHYGFLKVSKGNITLLEVE